MVVKQDDGFPDKTRAVHSYADGGVFQYNAISPAGPLATGTWSRHGKSYRVTFWAGFEGDAGPGSIGQTVRVRLVGMLRHGTISGTYRVSVFAPGSETEVVLSLTGKFSGRRINA